MSTRYSSTPAARVAAIAVALLTALALALGLTGAAYADSDEDELTVQSVMHLPDVTDEMMDASYWSAKQQNPNTVLADRATIDALNEAGVEGDGTGLQPLREASGTYYNATKQQTLKTAATNELNDMLASLDRYPAYKENWELIDQAYVDGILANYPTDGVAPNIVSPYAVVTTHTTMRAYPTDDPILCTENDYDDNNLYVSALRVNEPLIIRAVSVDQRFYLCISSCINAAWVPVEDVAICADRDEWLDAWDIPAGQELVVTGYKVFTEKSEQTPNISKRMLYMGTVLERVDLNSPEEALEIVGTSSAFDRHVCYLPVRNSDGTYSKELALIGASAKVSEGYLPLTTANISEVAFRSLGQMYGWGGMLEANDCSGYVRDVYKCFGLELARNTTWQMNLPVRSYDLSGLDDAHKAAAIAQMPLGTVLFWGGHEMIYLGQENGKLYVISAVGGIGDIYDTGGYSYQVKGVIVNTLDMLRANRNTWLTTITWANVPYISNATSGPSLYDVAFYEHSATWPKKTYEPTGKAITPKAAIDGLVEGEDYKVTYKNNTNPGTATVTISGIGNYSGSISRSFEIDKLSQTIKATKTVKKPVKASAKTKKLAKNKTFSLKNLAKVSAQTPVEYKKTNKVGGKKIVVNPKTGKVTLKKGLKKGTYKVKVKLTAPADSTYKAAKAKTITLKVVVK